MSLSHYKAMRLILFFDLPVTEESERSAYTHFHKGLILNGYTMIQFSVYAKPINVQTKVEQEVKRLQKYLPKEGKIRVISVTEKQLSEMFILLGDREVNEIYNNNQRYVKL